MNDKENFRLGRGCVFHISPSNVPVNYAYSLVVGLLTGNTNIVRISSKDFPQVEIINKLMKGMEINVNKLKLRILGNEFPLVINLDRWIYGRDENMNARFQGYYHRPMKFDKLKLSSDM